MDKEQHEVSLFAKFLHNTGTIFTLSLLVITFINLLFSHIDKNIKEISSLFALVQYGLAYSTILQITGFSVVLAGLATFLFSEHFFKKILFLRRTALFFIATLFVLSGFSVIFKWFPVNDPLAWLGFIVSTLICFSASIGLTLVKLRLEGIKYSKLLEEYKLRQK
ncbi:hypothetical protein FACS189444_6550 [Spirochaetia bacterium]|nr:hypothetical protein FACS189444_6550 [Spirochaetia bacterium]